MAQDTPLGFPAHTLHPQGVCSIRSAAEPLAAALPYRCGEFTILSTVLMAVYEALKVKRWKRRMPTYDNALFDPRLHTWDEVAQAMCQAELVHETIALLSFLPIAAGLRFGAYPVFIVTSVLSAGYDLLFVMMQRYNRQRIMALLERKRTSSAYAAQSAR